MYKVKKENKVRLDDKGTDFNYTDEGYQTMVPHQARVNKRPTTAKPHE